MYYNRTIKNDFANLIEPGGSLRWLYNYVKDKDCLDFLIGKSDKNQWISVYRGLSRILTINPTNEQSIVKIDAADTYKKIAPKIYGKQSISFNFRKELDQLLCVVENSPKLNRYYDNKKEGFFQNKLSRQFGICGLPTDNFVIIDKEAVIGYTNTNEKNNIYGKIRNRYKELQGVISKINPIRYGKDLGKKSIGNELDFLALDKEGNLLLIEYKHGTNTSGIYLSPLQIGMYYDLFTELNSMQLEKAVYEMLEQKKKIGLINSSWKIPNITNIIPVLIISDYNYRSTAKEKYDEILGFVRKTKGTYFLKEIRTYNYTSANGLIQW